MKIFLLSLASSLQLLFIASGVTPEDLYATEFWQIEGPPRETRWVEIHNPEEAAKTGIAHISIISRKTGAPVWEIQRLRPHLAITTEALRASAIKPIRVKAVYPEAYEQEYAKWQADAKQDKAFICRIPLPQYLARKN